MEFDNRIIFTWLLKRFIRWKGSKNPELQPWFEPGNPWIHHVETHTQVIVQSLWCLTSTQPTSTTKHRHQFHLPPATKLFPNKIWKSTFDNIERCLQVQFVRKLSRKGKSQNLLRSYIYSIIDWVDSRAIPTLLFVEVVYWFVTQLDDTHVRFVSHPRLDPRPHSPALVSRRIRFAISTFPTCGLG